MLTQQPDAKIIFRPSSVSNFNIGIGGAQRCSIPGYIVGRACALVMNTGLSNVRVAFEPASIIQAGALLAGAMLIPSGQSIFFFENEGPGAAMAAYNELYSPAEPPDGSTSSGSPAIMKAQSDGLPGNIAFMWGYREFLFQFTPSISAIAMATDVNNANPLLPVAGAVAV